MLAPIRVAFVFACVTLLPSVLCGTSQRMANPVAGLKTFKIELTLGGPMHRDSTNTADLFRGSGGRADAFELRVREAISKRFVRAGIVIDPGAKHTFLIGIWGRPITEGGCDNLTVAVIEASFHDERILDEPGYQGESTITWGRNIIEIATDESLEESLQTAILDLVEEVLERGTGDDE